MSASKQGLPSPEQVQQAVALSYGSIQQLPRVVASGQAEAAQRILELAQQLNVPVHQDGKLAELLAELSVGSQINAETFHLVAEVICFLYFVDRSWRESHPFLSDIVDQA